MKNFHGATFTGQPPVACNHERIVAVNWNREIYESAVDSIYWRLLTALPREVAGGRNIRGIHLSPSNQIYILTYSDLYRFDETLRTWRRLTESLQRHSPGLLNDIAVSTGGVILISTRRGRLFRSMNDGADWALLDSPYVGHHQEGNDLQYSPEGTLYINTSNGLFRSANHGSTMTLVVPGAIGSYTDGLWTNNTYIVVNDTTIYGIDMFDDVWTVDHATPEWRLLRKVRFGDEYGVKIGVGANGVLYCRYAGRYETEGNTIEWSTDRGVTWRQVSLYFPDPGSWRWESDILYGDTSRVILYDHLFNGGEVFEVLLPSGRSYRRVAPIARHYALHIYGNSSHFATNGQFFNYIYNKKDGTSMMWHEVERIKPRLREDMRYYFQVLARDPLDAEVATRVEPISFTGSRYINCYEPSDYVLTSRGDVLIVKAEPDPLFGRVDYLCKGWKTISTFGALHLAINRDDRFVAVDALGEFEYYDASDILLSKGRLQPYMDSVRSIQNDTRGNLVFLGMEVAYYSGDYGQTWAQSLLPNNGSAMLKVIVDHRDHFYALDADDGIYWSRDAGASFVKLPIDFDSLYCGVTDILVDEEYLYCSTSGCGVFRCALPSLNSADFPHAAAQSGESLNLYVGQERHARITVPFALDDSPHFRLTDISGRILHAVQYTVDRRTSTLHIDTQGLSNGVYPFMIWSGASSRSGKLILRR